MDTPFAINFPRYATIGAAAGHVMLDDEGGQLMRDEVKWKGLWWNNTLSAGQIGIIFTLLGGFVGAIFGAGVLWNSYIDNNQHVADRLDEIRHHQDETTGDLKNVLGKMSESYDSHLQKIDSKLEDHTIAIDRLEHALAAPAPSQFPRSVP